VSKPRRNAPCPCGSGRKYKKCCLAEEAVAQRERRRLHHEQEAHLARERAEIATRYRDGERPVGMRLGPSTPLVFLDDDPLDDLSNSVIDLIRDKNFDEALRVCDELLADYSDVIDGFSRRAEVHAAMGEHRSAADFYQRCLDFIEHNPDGFEEASVEYYDGKRLEMLRLAETG